METILYVFFGYVQCLGSWWWITLSVLTFVSTIIIVLKEDDYTLSTLKALQLSVTGILLLIPLARNHLPLKLKIDFWTRWTVLELNSFFSFTLTFTTLSFLVMPVMLVFVFGLRAFANFIDFATDIECYGFKQTMKWRLRLK